LTRGAAAVLATTFFVLFLPTPGSASFSPTTSTTYTLTVVHGGQGAGRVTSSPTGIDCISTCSHAFPAGAQVTLTADLTVNTAFEINAGTAPCVVPKLRGKTLVKAKTAIRNAYCTVGKITKAYSARVRKGRVISQKPTPGTRHPTGAKVKLTVSKGRQP
jgi:PASTA domain-containing protein